ncbi:hypothetical protein D9B85_05675 [Corynebacterium diphtheriae]|uniref:hypothetical protein n=1 Tax=Corynebacterium diphtheriae TaxID=1717 RepID=UPI000F119169|nr:hypothetical protein [Corynebacterium diphtheriae]MBG9296456.1 hypothetical protein [Corynebacterium diphtheriae bv. gravis]MBG9339220.1 hypothetical protein [Corynebacterium diphtheriae bv. mitis]RKW87821.1 hypothetical protein D9B36_12105 [Corynebacterium diphtheriae]RKX01511.1 hypothetical protein D9B85_05675 [Corynebacterium diphtheriae]RLP08652.1 hypothetical protein D9R17_06255 [Corynebacterium diphtheriae]
MSDKMFLLDGNNPAKDPNSKDARHRKTTTEVKELDSGLTPETLKAQLRKEMDSEFSLNHGLFGNILSTLGKILAGAVQFGVGVFKAFAEGVKAFIDGIANALKGMVNNTIFDPLGKAVKEGQLELNNRVDLLSPIQDYGSVYIPSGDRELKGAQTLPFTAQIGPMKGCKQYKYGILLLDKGLWDIRAQVTSSWVRTLTLGQQDVPIVLKVYAPNGELFSSQRSNSNTAGINTQTIVSSVVVPEAGYYVEVEVEYIYTGRGIYRGPAWTRLTAQHISREVHGSWEDGSGESLGQSRTGE